MARYPKIILDFKKEGIRHEGCIAECTAKSCTMRALLRELECTNMIIEMKETLISLCQEKPPISKSEEVLVEEAIYTLPEYKIKSYAINRVMRRIESEEDCNKILDEFLRPHEFGMRMLSCNDKRKVARYAIQQEIQKEGVQQ